MVFPGHNFNLSLDELSTAVFLMCICCGHKKAAEAAESLIFYCFSTFIIIVLGKTPMSRVVEFILLAEVGVKQTQISSLGV